MSYVIVAAHYQVPGIRAAADFVSTRSVATINGLQCAIITPPEDSLTPSDDWQLAQPADNRMGSGFQITEHRIYELRIEVKVPAGPTVVTLPQTEGDEPTVEHRFDIEEAFKRGESAANELVTRYLDQIRMNLHQSWLRSSSTVHRVIRSEVIDERGSKIAEGLPDGRGVIVMLSGEPGLLTRQKSDQILEGIDGEPAPELADLLLADALLTGWPSSNPNYRLAVLLAAMACEMKIKDTLTLLAKPEQQDLVTLIINSPREYTFAAINLFHKGLQAVCGRSLSKDNNDLFESVQTLFTIRNSIVHKGGSGKRIPAEDDLAGWLNQLRVAQSAFDYLNEVIRDTRQVEDTNSPAAEED